MLSSLQDIRDKYLHDVSYIRDHVQYLEEYFLASLRSIGNIGSVSPTLSANITISNICDNNTIVQNEMLIYWQNLYEERQSMSIVEKQPDEPSRKQPTPEGDTLLYLLSSISKGEEDREKLFDAAQLYIEMMCVMKGDLVGFEDYFILSDDPNRIRRLVDIAFEETKRRKYKFLSERIARVQRAAKSLDLFDSTNQINTYKQSFIQIMAYFDSCIFEMVRFCMKKDFFQWLLYFENVNVKTHDIAGCHDFDSFRDIQIEASLKKCYVKDLLKILHDRFEGAFSISSNDIYPSLREMIGRRNVHIHHNGIADQMYTDQYNLFGVAQGDYLQISKEYFDRTIEITTQVVSAIATICS